MPTKALTKSQKIVAKMGEADFSIENTKIAEFIAAFEKMMPLAELASYMVRIVRSKKTKVRDRMSIINFLLNAKKFTEKNSPGVNEDDLANMSDEQIDAVLKDYVPDYVAVKNGQAKAQAPIPSVYAPSC